MYDYGWHHQHREKTLRSAEYALGVMSQLFRVNSILDVGCGDGTWLGVARDLKIPRTQGVDGSWTKIDQLQVPSECIKIADLQDNFNLNEHFDLAISLEVAEHLPLSCADQMVDNIIRHSDLIMFGAAIPYQGGYRHINERWQSFWSAKFAERGYKYFDILRPILWSKKDVHFWYKQNTLIYINHNRNDLVDIAQNFLDRNGGFKFPLDIVHPEKYEALASYDQIAFKPLFRKLPRRLGSKLLNVILRKT